MLKKDKFPDVDVEWAVLERLSKGVALYGVETVELGCEPLVHQELKFGGGGVYKTRKV